MLKKFIISVVIFTVAAVSMTAQVGKRNLTLKDTIKDPSVQIPKDLDHNLEELLIDWKKSFRKPSTYNPANDKDVVYPDSVYINRLYSLPSEMELAYNQIVRQYIDLYSSRRRTSVGYMLAKGRYYFPLIEETLDKYALPLELKYLPVIESAINPVAVSRAGATGLWQFMLATGRMYDLEVNSLVDERRDPIKSTEAAARYLKDLYDIYGDWNLVIAAYNCGPGNVNKAIRRSGGQRDYWSIYPYLPKETRGYVPAFIAATYIMSYYPKHNIQPMEYNYPTLADTLIVNKNLHFQQISDMLNIPIEEIRDLNPQYKKDIIPGDFKKYALCLPSDVVAQFINNQDTIFQHKAQEYMTHRKVVEAEGAYASSNSKGARTHKVKRGDTLGAIARKYGVTVAQIQRLNNMRSTSLSVGKTLIISAPRKTTQTAQKPAKQTAQEPPQEAKPVATVDTKTEPQTDTATTDIEKKETNESSSGFFAEYYKNKNVGDDDTTDTQTPEQLANDSTMLESDETEIDTDREHFEDISTIYHKVRIGETLALIANRYNIPVKDIQNWNQLTSKKVKIGQRLKILLPQKEAEKLEVAKKQAETQKTSAETTQQTPQVQQTKKTTETKPTQEKPKTVPQGTTYRVKKGDTLSEIAKRYRGVSANDIIRANNLKNDRLSIGQTLKIPAK